MRHKIERIIQLGAQAGSVTALKIRRPMPDPTSSAIATCSRSFCSSKMPMRPDTWGFTDLGSIKPAAFNGVYLNLQIVALRTEVSVAEKLGYFHWGR